MACPLCGEVCHCSFAPTGADASVETAAENQAHTSVLIDPDLYDPSEEQFAASVAADEADSPLELDAPVSTPAPGMQAAALSAPQASAPAAIPARPTTLTGIERVELEMAAASESAEGWRDEVASRLNNYRARRRRRGTEGAMQLDFDEPEEAPVSAAAYRSAALERVAARFAERPMMEATAPAIEEPKIIEFPKPPAPVPQPVPPVNFLRPVAVPPAPALDELAEAIPETPRILDAPESEELPAVMPPVTAITLEGEGEVVAQEPEDTGFAMYVAPVGRRASAALIDAGLVMLACVIFGVIAVKMAPVMPPAKTLLTAAAGIYAMLWSVYEYLFVVYGGATPGMEMSHLMLVNLNGQPLDPATRRFRAAGTIVAALPLGLGFFWALIDSESLGWHDRMSNSCLAEVATE